MIRGKEKDIDCFPFSQEQGKREIEKGKNKIMGVLETGMIEEFTVIGGLILVQFVYAGNSIFLNYLMLLGIDPLTIIIFTALATFLLLSAPSVYFESSKWPKKFTPRLLIKLVMISIAGVTLFQILFLKGIELTSPAMATAMPNLAPGLIFVIAAVFRMEKINLSCIYSKLKISGTLLCVAGAFTLSIMQSTGHTRIVERDVLLLTHPETCMFDTQKIMGCVYLVAAVLVLSSNVVLQASTLAEFPAPISMCAIISFFGMISTIVWELIRDQKFDYGWPVVSTRDLATYSVMGGIVGGISVSFIGWAMKKRGPVFVSMFNPIGTVISVILSFLTMGEVISIGSLASMFLLFSGLYFFLWAKGKEEKICSGLNVDHGDEETPSDKLKDDIKRPLLP